MEDLRRTTVSNAQEERIAALEAANAALEKKNAVLRAKNEDKDKTISEMEADKAHLIILYERVLAETKLNIDEKDHIIGNMVARIEAFKNRVTYGEEKRREAERALKKAKNDLADAHQKAEDAMRAAEDNEQTVAHLVQTMDGPSTKKRKVEVRESHPCTAEDRT